MNARFPESRGRILFVSRQLVVGGQCGSDDYVISVLEALTQSGFEIDYLWLGVPARRSHWQRWPSRTAGVRRFFLPYAWRWLNRVGPRDPVLWLWILLKRAWNFTQRSTRLQQSGVLRRIGNWLKARLALTHLEWGSLPRRVDTSAFLRAVDQSRPALVMVNYYFLAPLFDALRGRPLTTAVLTHNARHPGVDLETEYACLRKADLLLAIHGDDVVELKGRCPQSEIIPFPMALVPVAAPRRPQPTRILFVGSVHNENVRGLRWFLHEIWPGVRAARPGMEFHVCGNIRNAISESFPQVHFLGMVENLAHEYAEASVVVVPLLGGQGLKIKLVEALRYGCAVVSTSAGTQGIRFVEGRCVAMADSASGFAEALLRLLRDEDERRKLEEQAGLVIQEYFSTKACSEPFRDWYGRKMNPDLPAEASAMRVGHEWDRLDGRNSPATH
jgi:glycosyltransferase involved in cell wall biosynthesis